MAQHPRSAASGSSAIHRLVTSADWVRHEPWSLLSARREAGERSGHDIGSGDLCLAVTFRPAQAGTVSVRQTAWPGETASRGRYALSQPDSQYPVVPISPAGSEVT